MRYRTGCLPPLILISFLATILFAIAALRPALVDELSEQRRGAWLAETHDLSLGGVNIPVALVAAYMFFELWRAILRLRDPRMLVSDEALVHFHPTERRKPIAWAEVDSVSHEEGSVKSDLWFRLRDGRTFRLRNCDEADAAALVAASVPTPPALSATPPAT